MEGANGWEAKTLTKGEAANLITRFKHGIQAYYEKRLVQAEKAEKAIEKEQRRLNSEVIKVGPLHGSRNARVFPL